MKNEELVYFHGSVSSQNIFISSSPDFSEENNLVAINISGQIKYGSFVGKKYDLQVSRQHDFDIQEKVVGALTNSKPLFNFVVKTGSEVFSYLVTMVTSKAVEEIYLCLETPKYGKAKVISWDISTSSEEE